MSGFGAKKSDLPDPVEIDHPGRAEIRAQVERPPLTTDPDEIHRFFGLRRKTGGDG